LFQVLLADRQNLGQGRQPCFLPAAWDLARRVLGSVRAGWNCCSSNNERLGQAAGGSRSRIADRPRHDPAAAVQCAQDQFRPRSRATIGW
jgi:hypothetical protein